MDQSNNISKREQKKLDHLVKMIADSEKKNDDEDLNQKKKKRANHIKHQTISINRVVSSQNQDQSPQSKEYQQSKKNNKNIENKSNNNDNQMDIEKSNASNNQVINEIYQKKYEEKNKKKSKNEQQRKKEVKGGQKKYKKQLNSDTDWNTQSYKVEVGLNLNKQTLFGYLTDYQYSQFESKSQKQMQMDQASFYGNNQIQLLGNPNTKLLIEKFNKVIKKMSILQGKPFSKQHNKLKQQLKGVVQNKDSTS